MAVYTVSIGASPTERLTAVAHLRPGDVLTVEHALGSRTLRAEDGEWLHVYDDDAGFRWVVSLSAHRLALNTRPRLRGPILAATRTVRDGGVARVRWEPYNYYGRTEWAPVGHVLLVNHWPECPANSGDACHCDDALES